MGHFSFDLVYKMESKGKDPAINPIGIQLEDIVNNQGLHLILINILGNLNQSDIANCRLVTKSLKYFIDFFVSGNAVNQLIGRAR